MFVFFFCFLLFFFFLFFFSFRFFLYAISSIKRKIVQNIDKISVINRQRRFVCSMKVQQFQVIESLIFGFFFFFYFLSQWRLGPI